MRLPPAPESGLLFVRTDYSDDAAWRAAFSAATAVYPAGDYDRIGALLHVVESPQLANLTPQDLVALPRTDYLSELAVADARTMRDRTVLFIDLNECNDEVGRTFRSVPEQVEPIVANLSLSNMDFPEFADRADHDGVFRGF